MRKEERTRAIAIGNKERLIRAVSAAVADGQISLREREQLLAFARAAKIPEAEVESLLQTEASRLLDALIEESLADGILDSTEKQRISEVAVGLGLTLNFTRDQSRRLEICELASQLAHGTFCPDAISVMDVALNVGETAIAHAKLDWHEVVKQKKPVGIPIGNEHYLKPVAKGNCVLTNKRIVLVDEFTAKKIALSSIERVRRYQDGVFCQRSTGKSVFLTWHADSAKTDRFSMLAEYAVTNQPVLGLIPTDSFIPDRQYTFAIDPGLAFADLDSPISSINPRYTFRVVGDHIGDREYWIDQINLGDRVDLLREPTNPYDSNAVSVLDPMRNQLGYLKREVAS